MSDDSKRIIPAIDHGILSPSGTVSKRARKAAQERARRELFGDGLDRPRASQPTEVERMLHAAAELRELAARGLHPRKFIREAERLERLARGMSADG